MLEKRIIVKMWTTIPSVVFNSREYPTGNRENFRLRTEKMGILKLKTSLATTHPFCEFVGFIKH